MKKLLILMWVVLLASCARPYTYTPLASMQELEYPYPTKFQTIDEATRIAYMEVGPMNGPVLLFIHGLGSYSPAWKQNLAGLQDKYRCIAIDLPGYGKSSKGAYEGSMTSFARMVGAFISAKGLKDVTVVGHSMGGQIAMTLALTQPEMVKQLVLAAPAGFETFSPGEKEWFRTSLSAKATRVTPAKQIVLNYHGNFYNMPKEADFMIRDRLAMRTADDFEWYCYIIPQSVKGMVNEPIFNRLPEIKQPVLVVFGENDELIPNRFMHGGTTQAVAEAGHQKLPNSELVMLPKKGHFVQFEGFEAFNEAVRGFVK
jgi:pimeloyl-ACP methyl ester carboxylesterase